MLAAEHVVAEWERETNSTILRGRTVLVSNVAEALATAAHDGTVLNLTMEVNPR
jgi:hypothetical protein